MEGKLLQKPLSGAEYSEKKMAVGWEGPFAAVKSEGTVGEPNLESSAGGTGNGRTSTTNIGFESIVFTSLKCFVQFKFPLHS